MPQHAVLDARRQRRIFLRTTAEERNLIEQAAFLQTSGDLTRFVLRASLEAAKNTVDRHEVTRVTDDTRRAIYDLLLNPPLASERLKKLAADPVPDGVELVDK
jgi:uncharacterized protein (DUF1778 family)